MKKNNNTFKKIENVIHTLEIDKTNKEILLANLTKLKKQKVNLMITGATGAGKSSTINALFDANVAKVGVGTEPETMHIKKYDLGNLVLWDSPGLGDGKEKDELHAKCMIDKLNELDEEGTPLIDMVLVVVDGGSRDLGTTYELINSIIIPNLGENPEKRILVSINQADIAMKGRYWNHKKNQPNKKLKEFLDNKVQSVKRRVHEATGVEIEPIYYVAGFKDDDESQRPYNLSKLLYFILQHTPAKKRLAYADNISKEKETWQDNDKIKDYNLEIKESFSQTLKNFVTTGIVGGIAIGGAVAGFAGAAIGAALGAVAGIFGSIFG